MHDKVDHLFAQKLKDKKTLEKGKQRNKLPPLLLSLILRKLPSDSFQCNLLYPDTYKKHFSKTLSVIFNFLFIFFDLNFYYYL